MAFSMNNKGARPSGGDPNATGDLSAAAQAASKPKRRSARGSDIAKQEKKERREKRAREAEAEKARSAERKQRGREAASRLATDEGHLRAVANRASTDRTSARGKHGGRTVAQGSPAAKAKRPSAAEKQAKPSLLGKIGGALTGIASAPAPQTDSASHQAFLKYANDNAVVRWFYQFTTGPQRHLFYALVVAFVCVGVYMPVRDLYIAARTEQVLNEQKAIRDAYNESIAEEAKQWLSEEGVRDTARKDLGMVMPGETPITVEGLDEDGNPIVVQDEPAANDGQQAAGEGGATQAGEDPDAAGQADAQQGEPVDGKDAAGQTPGAAPGQDEDSGMLKGSEAADKSKTGSGADAYDPSKTPTTSAEVEAAEEAVFENSPWWWKVLDAIFLFNGVNGMAVVSTGE